MMWTRPEARTSEKGGAPGFDSCGGQHKLNRIILRQLSPYIDEYHEWSLCAVVTFSSHTCWILGAKTSRKSVHCKVRFTLVYWANSFQLFCLSSSYVAVSAFKFLYLDKNVHAIGHWMNMNYNLSFLDQFFILATCLRLWPCSRWMSAGSFENGGRLRARHGVKTQAMFVEVTSN